MLIVALLWIAPTLLLAQLPGGLSSFGGGNSSSTTTGEYKPLPKKVNPHPLYTGTLVGVDLFDPAAKLLGQSYGGYTVSAEVGIRNRFFPTWEIGIGSANNTPETGNFTFVGKPSIYNRIGVNYNLNYTSKSTSFFYVGVRYGASWFNYDITDITYETPYWGEVVESQLLDQRASAHWGEALAGIRVGLTNSFYMGWSIRYKFLLMQSNPTTSNPWYIPGYGATTLPVGFTYTLSYKLPI